MRVIRSPICRTGSRELPTDGVPSAQQRNKFGSWLWFLLLLFPAYMAQSTVESAMEELLGSEEVWVYGTCYDYFSNMLHCNPATNPSGAGLTIEPGQVVLSSGCTSACTPLEKPYAYRKSPYNADSWAGFLAFAAVMAFPYLIGHSRNRSTNESETPTPL